MDAGPLNMEKIDITMHDSTGCREDGSWTDVCILHSASPLDPTMIRVKATDVDTLMNTRATEDSNSTIDVNFFNGKGANLAFLQGSWIFNQNKHFISNSVVLVFTT